MVDNEDYLADPGRLRMVQRTGLLDILPDSSLQRLVRLAARLTHAPTALVSLVDKDRQFFAAHLGLGEPWASLQQTPLTHSFCQHVVRSREPLIVEAAREHPLVKDNLAIPELGVEAYLGTPLVLEGQCIGSLCAIEGQERRWSDDDLSALQDLAELVTTELRLRAAYQAKVDFLARASHELRTPLHGILGSTEVALQLDPAGPRSREMVQAANDNARTLLEIVDELLELHKLDSTVEPLQRVAFRLPEAMARLEIAFRGHGRDISFAIAPGVAETLLEDWSKVESVLANLIGNAVKYTHGPIEVGVRKVGDRILYEVKDQGMGLPPESLEHIFEPFERLRSDLPGTGLGLTIARRTAELLDGHLAASSVLGEGTTFCLSLPYREGELTELSPQGNAPATPAKSLSVLVVDDYELNLELLDAMLRLMGHRPTLVQQSAEALEVLQEQTFDVVMLDLRMPGMDGFELFSRAPRRPGQRVYAFSADAIQETSQKCMEMGFDGVLFKPLSREALAGILAG